ncbi:energy coupling factor transporter S component ThiW [Aminivibrio sp.]
MISSYTPEMEILFDEKICIAGMLGASAVLLSGFSFPVGLTRCFPFQHTVNALAGALLGPWWAAGIAFIAASLRNLLGTGTLFAFPGSIPGALIAGFAFRLFKSPAAALGEPLGTTLVGAPLAALVLGPAMERSAGLLSLSGAFLLSSLPGSLIATALLAGLEKTPLLASLRKDRS